MHNSLFIRDLIRRTDGRFHSCIDMIAEKARWLDRWLGQRAESSSPASKEMRA
jgi:hypothetical protein